MRFRNTALLFSLMLALASCGTDSKRIDYKTASARVPSLEIPPDLTAPSSNEQFVIPGGDGAFIANYSDYSKGAQSDNTPLAVLPTLNNVRIEHGATEHWLVVNDKAENIWPAVKSFWLEMGFLLQLENPQAGVMETDWQENLNNAPKNFTRRVLGNGKSLDSIKSSGQRDQYVTRLERSKDGLSTEIHLSRQVMQEVLSSNLRTTKWLPYTATPEIQNAVLQMMMARLGNTLGQPAASAVAVTTAAAETLPSVLLKETPGGKVLQINDAFDKSWRKIGLALEKAHLAVEDKDRSSGTYLLHDKSAGKGKIAMSYQVLVHESGAACEVSVRNANGLADEDSARILDALYLNIEK